MNTIEHAERAYPLYPGQRFALKVLDGVPLSDTDRVEFTHPLTGRVRLFTEKDFLVYLYDEGRSNTREVNSEEQLVALAAGRRSGKSYLGARLLYQRAMAALAQAERDPGAMTVAGFTIDRAMAQTMMKGVRKAVREGHVTPSQETTSSIQIPSPNHCVCGCKTHNSSVRITVRSAGFKGLCGVRHSFVLFDEMAYYHDDGGTDLYQAVLPSVVGSSLPGPSMVALSSAGEKQGQFYRFFNEKLDRISTSVRLCTWEMNPTVPGTFYQDILDQGGLLRFMNEYGSEFLPVSKRAVAA
jgi:hypothetical protein